MSLDDFNATRYDIHDEEQRQKKAQAIYNLHTAYGANPDDEAEKVKIARETNTPVELMGDPEVRQEAGRQAYMKTVNLDESPGTVDFLSNHESAKIAAKQIREISGVERTLRGLAVGATRDVLGSGIKGMGVIINARGRIAKNIPGSQLPFEFGLPQLAHEIGLGDVLTTAGENIKQYYGQFAPKGEQTFGDQVAAGVGQMAPQLAMFSNPFTAPLGVLMMAGQGTDQMAEKIAMDKDAQKASQYRQDMELLSGGLITAVTEWATSKFQLKGLQTLVLKNRLLDKTVKIVLGGVEEGAQEFTENIGQDLVHIAATNPDSQLALGQAIEAGEIGGIVGTIAQSVIQGALHIKTRGTQRRYQELSDASKAQKLRDMEPATYQDFTDRVTANLAGSADGAVTDIYVDGNTFHQVMLERGFDPDEVAMAVPSIGQQMAEARATGGDIVIPLNEFAGKISGTEIGDALEPHIRSTADAYSVAELDAATKFAPAFDEQMRSISEKTQAYRDWMASQKEVRDTVYNQLVETGTYTKAASRSFSALVGNFYATQAREMGMTPAELYARLPYKVLAGEIAQGQMTQDAHGITYDQTGQINLNENFQKWFGESKVVDETGAPMVVYHGTPGEEFTTFDKERGGTGPITGHPIAKYGFWFSPKESYTDTYAGKEGAKIPVYISMTKPYRMKMFGKESLSFADERGIAIDEKVKPFIDKIKATGYDGIEIIGSDGQTKEYMVFEPTQIKSVNNRGTWDPNDPNILNQSFAGMSEQAAQIVESLREGGLNITPENQSIAPSNLLYSTRTWTQMEKSQIKDLAKQMDIDEKAVEKWMFDIDNAMARVLADPSLDFIAEAADLYSALKANSDPHYTVSLDFSTLCRKRYELMATIEAIQNLTGRAITKDTWVDVRARLDQLGYNVSCGACYVDAKRMEAGKFVNEFIDAHPGEDPRQFLSQAGIDKLKRDKPELYAEFKKKLGSNNAKTPESRTDYHGEIREYFIASPAGKKRVEDMNKRSGLRWQSWSDFEVPHLMDAMQAILDMHLAGLMGHAYTKVPDFVLAMGKTGLMVNMSLIPKGTGLTSNGDLIFDTKEGMPFDVALKLREAHENTAGTIAIGISNDHIKALLADPRIDYVIPYHASGLSKEIAKKFNMDGWEDYTDTQSEDIADFQAFHKKVGKKNGKLVEFYKAEMAKKPNRRDFTKYRKAAKAAGLIAIDTTEYWDNTKGGKENADAYLALVADRGLAPKFRGKEYTNGKVLADLTGEEGYWKVLIDRKMYDHSGKPIIQKPVEPVYDDKAINDIYDRASKNPVPSSAVPEVVNDVARSLGYKGTLFQSAWHGSPHTFEKFSLAAIGTGEGAQVYGYGLYFADRREVGEFYKQSLGKVTLVTKSGGKTRRIDLKKAAKRLRKSEDEFDVDQALDFIGMINTGEITLAQAKHDSFGMSPGGGWAAIAYRLLRDVESIETHGRLYKVEITPEEDEYLLWDKPFSEQSEKVKEALKNSSFAENVAERKAGPEGYKFADLNSLKGSEIYGGIKKYITQDAKAASNYLHALGIRGVKYLAGDSRNRGPWVIVDEKGTRTELGNEETAKEVYQREIDAGRKATLIEPEKANYNYVLFSDKDVEIREMWQKQQGGVKRGGFNPETLTTVLTQSSDYSTFLHESAHFFLTAYSQIAEMPEATAQIKEDMQTVLDWFGVKDLNEWNALTLEQQRKHHEAFAYNFEIYLFGGKAPSIKMQGVFERFAAWLKKVYQSIRDELNAVYRQEHGTDLPVLTGEVKQVMDRMLASDQQIEQAEYAASMGAIFQTQAESGMDDATWAAYLDMQEEAHQDAVREHRKASMRQMKWLSGAKSKYVKLLQTEANFQRGKITEQVIKEVNEMPIYVAKDAMKNATPDEQMAIADGMGYKSIDELKAAIANAPKKSAVVKEEVDRRMLEENGELVDPRMVEQKVNEAIHNEARQRFITVELRHLAKSTQPVRIMQAAAKMAAQKMLGRKMIFELRPRDYTAAEARAGKAAEQALKAGDFAGAVKAKENQLLQNALAVEAMKARGEVETALKNWKKLFRPDDKVAKTHDMNYVGVARAILAKYTYGKDPIGASDKPASYYVDNIKKYDPDFFAEIEGLLGGLDKEVKDIKQTSLNEFRDLVEQVGALWHLSRRNKQSEVDGQLVDRTEIVRELNEHLRGMNLKEFRPGLDKAVTGWEKKQMMFMGARAAFRRVEAWVDAMDGNRPGKPFRKYIWNPISDAVTKYRLEKTKYLKEYVDLIGEYKHLFNQGPVRAEGLGYTFNADRKNGSELMHAILHTGNDSNKRKLLVGRGWATIDEATGIMDSSRWDAFIRDCWAKGILTKEHYDFAQKIWNLMEKMKPAAQRAHHDMYGYYFDEITADPISTPWGLYDGGYVPAKTDPDTVTEAEMQREQETIMGDNSFMFPTTGRGFTMKRVEYNKQLLLNLSSLAGHIDKVLKFAYIEPRVKDVARIVKTNRAFGEAMDAIDPTIRGDMLVPWLQRTAMQIVSIPSTGKAGRAADKAFTWLRTNTGMQMMVGNITNTLQQFTGIPIVITKVKAHYVRNALWYYVKAPKETTEFVQAKSDYMKTRIDNYSFEMQATMDAYLNDVNKFEKLQDFAQKHGYFLQQGTQGIVDTVAWISAYNQAVEQNMEEAEAIRAADSVVRETQGSFAPEDISRVETGSAFVRMFTHFYSYFNMLANLNATEFTKTVREMGVKRGMGRLLHTYTFGFMIPAVMAEIIVQAAGGFDTGDDDEWDFWDAFALFFSAQGRAIAGMVPGVGPAIMVGFNAYNSKPYDDRISTSPAVSTLESAARTLLGYNIYKAIADDGSWKRVGKDMLTTIGLIFSLPLGQLGKPVGYLADVAQGKAKPESPMDVVRGVISGKDVNRKQ